MLGGAAAKLVPVTVCGPANVLGPVGTMHEAPERKETASKFAVCAQSSVLQPNPDLALLAP